MGNCDSDFKRKERNPNFKKVRIKKFREVMIVACFLVPMTLAIITTVLRKRFPESYRINVLNLLLWGGVVALALEHGAHMEIVPYPPFLTAGVSEIFPEMLTVGVPMLIATTGMWTSIIIVTRAIHGEAFRLSRLGITEIETGKRAK